jgi:hypothetical protein
MDSLPSGNDPAKLADVRQLGWCWGGFLMPYFWLLGHGRVTWGMLLTLTALVPPFSFLHLVAYPWAAVLLGRRGFEIAWTHTSYHSVADLREGEKEWVLWGWVFKAFLLASTIFFAVYMVWVMSRPELRELFQSLQG